MDRQRAYLTLHGLILALFFASASFLTGCLTDEDAIVTATYPPEPTPTIEQELRSAFALADRLQRREAVLRAVADFLRTPAVRQMDDQAASSYLAEIAFSSASLTLDDPALISRQGSLAVVGIPDGLGLYLFDPAAQAGQDVYLISEWSAGLSALATGWMADEIGVGYTTISADGASFAHFALVRHQSGGWQVTWFSDEQPDWWFNARNAVISVAADLSQITMTGQAENSTSAFLERGTAPRRIFDVTWLREETGYRSTLPPDEGTARQQWLWDAAHPSPYATLVEFVERIRIGDIEGAGGLATDQSIVSAAVAFGLYLSQNQYQVTAASDTAITFQGQQGTFVATFQPPASEGGRWLIADLRPPGAEGELVP